MKTTFLLILILNCFISYNQIINVQKISTDIVSSNEYSTLMKYSSKFYKDKDQNFLYLDGLKEDGDQLFFLDDNLNPKQSFKLKDIPKDILPIKVKGTNTHTYTLFHSFKTFYVSAINNKTKTISNFEFKSGVKNKNIVKYLASENSFIVAYKDKKERTQLKFWIFDFNKQHQSQSTITIENTDYEEAYHDLKNNKLVLLRSENNVTVLSTVNLDDLSFEEIRIGIPNLYSSKPKFKSKIYNGKLIQVFKNLSEIKILVFDNYLNNLSFKEYIIAENNVDYYTRKNSISSKNVKTLKDFFKKTQDSNGLGIEAFYVDNNLTLLIDVLGLAHHNMFAPGGFDMPIGQTVNESSIGKIKTSIEGESLQKYNKLTPKEALSEIKKNIRVDLIMENSFELNNKFYLCYYDLNLNKYIILEYFR